MCKLFRRFPDDDRLNRLHKLLAHLRPRSAGGNFQTNVAIECVLDPFYVALFAHLANAMRKKNAVQVDLLVSQSYNSAVGFNVVSELVRSFPLNWLMVNQWVRVWSVVSCSIAYRCTSLRHAGDSFFDVLRAWRVWRQFRSIEDLEALSVEGIPCGDLVIDSYLRFRPSPRLVLGDWFLLRLLWQTYRDVRRAKYYFRQRKPIAYITTYTTYIHHGIPARVALQEGVRLISFGNFQEFGKIHAQSDLFHTRNTLTYKLDFARLSDPTALLEVAQSLLDIRLSGGIDTTISYMKVAAHVEKTNKVPDVQGAVIVFLHDFYDSPHVYADFIFPDFWEWICFTLQTLMTAEIRCFIKPHPNQITISNSVIDELLRRFPEINLIASEITNRQLAVAGMACAVTVYGTVANEMAYLGVPTIACARHPQISFNFCRTATNRTSYGHLLREAISTASNPKLLRDEALQFFVMHYLNDHHSRLVLRDSFVTSWKVCLNPLSSAEEIVKCFEEMAELPGFQDFVEKILSLSLIHI